MMDAQAILDIIKQEAKQQAQKLMAEANDRVLTIHEESDLRLSAKKAELKSQVAQEALQLEDRMRRLNQLEARKHQLSTKRVLIDQVFDQALAQLHALPVSQMQELVLGLIESSATGEESVMVGDINPAFFTKDFLQLANQRLQKAGKAGKLSDANKKAAGVCGLILLDQRGETHCTVEAMLSAKRERLEPQVAKRLFPDNA